MSHKNIVGLMLGMAAVAEEMSPHRDNPLDGPARGNCAANKTGCYYFQLYRKGVDESCSGGIIPKGGCLNPGKCEHKSIADGSGAPLVSGEKFVCDGATHTITKVDGATLTAKPFCSYCKRETNDLRAVHNKRCEKFMACRKCRRARRMKI